jgi:hypothetical protein
MGVGALSWGNLWDTTLAHLVEKRDWQRADGTVGCRELTM